MRARAARGAAARFEQRGVHELRGVPGRWEVHALCSNRLAAVAGSVDLGPPRRRSRSRCRRWRCDCSEAKLVGRDADLRRCVAALDRVREREPRTIFIVGEPGIGKTRLAAEVAGTLHASGATVLCGRCDPSWGCPTSRSSRSSRTTPGSPPGAAGRAPGPATAASSRAWCPSWAASPLPRQRHPSSRARRTGI